MISGHTSIKNVELEHRIFFINMLVAMLNHLIHNVQVVSFRLLFILFCEQWDTGLGSEKKLLHKAKDE